MLAFATANLLFGSLIPIGPVPESGSGLGNVETVLTFTSPRGSTSQTGCVGAGVGGLEITGSSACPAQFTGGNEQAINNTFSATGLLLTDFRNLQLIFNADEPQNPADRGITLDLLALTLFNPISGMQLATFYTDAAFLIENAFPGVGNAGFGFRLDNAQAQIANMLLVTNPTLFLGVAANASNATGGIDTVSLRVVEGGIVPSDEFVPEPSTYALVGIALVSAAAWNGRKRS